MKLFGFVVLGAVLTFCGIGERLQSLTGQSGSNSSNTSRPTGSPGSSSDDSDVETAEMTSAQRSISDAATEVQWTEQNMSWKLPSGWPKMSVAKESFNYGSPANGFLIASISVMPSTFPSESSINATYDSALEQLKQGKYETVRWLEIDGVKGVEWVESPPEQKDGIRRHQWIAFRNYQGQNQQINIIISTNGDNFGKQKDTFGAILYSMKIAKG